MPGDGTTRKLLLASREALLAAGGGKRRNGFSRASQEVLSGGCWGAIGATGLQSFPPCSALPLPQPGLGAKGVTLRTNRI